ncbi:LTA synthase family protein [Bacillus sp. REN3]|uniref:LTA synthase family protein n=1 Tax=Bacillus sp. REN3 TaxID=2802440 RepID=UPI001AEF1D30|nr:LTA synthase family protein [Bacillus sp. REN3]
MKFPYSKKFWLYSLVLFLVITVAWGLKTLYFVHELELVPHKKFILFASGGFSLALLSLLVLKKSKLSLIVASLLYILFNILLYADVVYERYYDAILHIELAGQANQVGEVFDSVISLIYKTDYAYWVDVPVVLLCFFWFNRKMQGERKSFLSTAFFGTGVVMLLFTAFFPLKMTFSDQYMVSLTGVIPAHIYTASHSLLVDTAAGELVSEDSAKLKEIRSEFRKNQELQKLSPYYGKFKGKNLIMIQAESLNTFPIGLQVEGEEVTPHINELIAASHYYPKTYLQIGRGNTSDAEFVANNSLYPMSTKGIYKTYPQNDYQSLATVMKKLGYQTSAAHGNSPDFWNRRAAYGKQGFTDFYHNGHPLVDDRENIGMGISDESMFSQMVEVYKKSEKPFYNFIITLSVHRPFELPEEYQSLKLPDEFEGTSTGHYLQSVHYFDKAVGKFIADLKKEGLWDETIFVMYGDHYGLLPKDQHEVKNLLGVPFGEKEQFNVPLIIHHPGQSEGKVNEKTASQMDIYPTISSLLGIEEPLFQFGKPLDIKQEGFVGFAYETTKHTFYSGRYNYHASHKGTFEAGTCLDNKAGEATDLEACRPGYNKVVKDIETSSFILENNLIKEIMK